MLKKADLILIICILGFVGLAFVGLKLYQASEADFQRVAVIKHNNSVIKKIDLDALEKPERIVVSGEFEQTILAEKGKIRYEHSECPDLICVKTGWLSKKGDAAVCVPNKTIIVIEGEERNVDGITY